MITHYGWCDECLEASGPQDRRSAKKMARGHSKKADHWTFFGPDETRISYLRMMEREKSCN